MKLKRAMMIMMCGVFILAMSGCGSNKDSKPDPEPEEAKEAKVTFEFSKTEKATAVNSLYKDSAHLVNVVVKTDQKITDIKFLNAEITDAEKEVSEFYVNSTGYEQKELAPDQSLVYATEFPGTTPSNLMSYKDATGDEKILYMSMSGKDGSAVSGKAAIVEKPEEPKKTEEPEKPEEPKELKRQDNAEKPQAAEKSANVSIYYLSDDELNSLPKYDVMIDPAFDTEADKPYLRNVIIKTDTTITGFKLLDCEVGMVSAEETGMIVNGVAINYGNIEPQEPLIIQTTFPGSASVRGISYIDASGEEKAFILSESGEDSSLVVTPSYISTK